MRELTDPLAMRFLQGLGGAATRPLGLAVSGGSDSRALLELAVACGLSVRVATVDHGLRDGSAAEAAAVAAVCAGLGVPHVVLRWQGWDGRGNLLDAARRARLALIGAWARGAGLSAVALGHTRDDVAETFLMRLARGAGVDGLAAMTARRRAEGIDWLRPLLGLGRDELRVWLGARGVGWTDDPTNELARFDRVRARRALVALAPLGLGAARLAEVAGHLAEVRAALEAECGRAAGLVAQADAGDLIFDRTALAALPDEVSRRVLVRAIGWISSAEYGPRGAALARFRAAVLAGQAATLAGVRALPQGKQQLLCREARAVAGRVSAPDAPWDGRWQISGPDINGIEVRALGAAGLLQVPGWRSTGRTRQSLLASPALWRGEVLISAPLAGWGQGWQVRPACDWMAFNGLVLSH